LALNKLPDEIRDDARRNPKCSRRVLLEIVRSKKRENGMVKLYHKYKERGLISGELRKQTRSPKGSREIKVSEIICRITTLRNRMWTFDLDGLSEEEREKLEAEVRNLMSTVAEKFGMTVS
jgi:hypothetical protein